MNRTAKTLLKMLIAGAIGGIIGAGLVSHHSASNAPRWLMFPRGMMIAIALICFFSIYWSAAAKNSAPTQSSESAWSRRLHLIVLNSAVLLLIFPVPGLTRRFLPASRILTAAGLAVEIAGILFAFWARRHLGRNWSGEVRIATGHQLIRSGPYKTIRHPIYTGVLAMYAGVMLVSGQIHALLAFLIITVTYWRKLRLEEKILSENFGPDWDSWRRATWALVPPLF
jgi:protein-S-isoprenylcysteine O-methyltransferase Ste14